MRVSPLVRQSFPRINVDPDRFGLLAEDETGYQGQQDAEEIPPLVCSTPAVILESSVEHARVCAWRVVWQAES